MEYKRKLVAAAEFVLATDLRAQGGGDPDTDSDTDPAEFGVSATLKPHQVQGVRWLIRRYLAGVNVVLGDEMGLGKTLQAISLLNYLKMKLLSRPFLVLCPLSVTDCWMSEFAKFCPDLGILRYVGDKRVRRDMRGMLFEHVQDKSLISDGQLRLPFDVLLTTYDVALLDRDFLSQIPWHFCVIDEAQRLKNPSSVLYNVLEQQYILPRRLLMTGTPIQNNLSELWALMHFCLPSVFGTLEQFLSTFGGNDMFFSDNVVNDGKGQFKVLKHILRAFMLRRTKYMLIESGALVLPLLTELTIIAPLAPLQKKVYVSILRKELQQLLAFSSGLSNQQSLQNIVLQLRKACSHPYLFNGIEPEPFEEGEHLVQASGKLILLDVLLQKLHMLGHRVLLFAQLTHTLDILQDYLELRKYTYERLDGSVRAEERFAAIRSFSVEASEDRQNPFIFMISTRAGGVGLNLVAADTVIFFEQDWNPQVDKQALQRAHRIGQLNNVLAINLVTGRTIEEVIKQRAERKLQLSNEVVGEVGDAFSEGKVINGDIRSLILGLHVFDLADISDNNSSELNINKLDKMADKVVRMHNPDQNNQKLEVDYLDLHNEDYMSSKGISNTMNLDPKVDEAAYQSWAEKFKEASQSLGTSILDVEKRIDYFDNERQKHESREKRLEEQRLAQEQKRLAKWEALGYTSMAVKRPISSGDSDILSNLGCVQYVYGDCTKPSKFCPSEPKIIFSCVDNSGNWGHGGMFDALASISDCVVDAYHQASEYGDLHLGDLHLIRINGSSHDGHTIPIDGEWVALAVVQSYNPRRKVPRSNISIEDLEVCLSKACFAAAQNSASLHMPRIGYQSGSQRSEWYAVERLLRKYSSVYGVKIFVYYFRRASQD